MLSPRVFLYIYDSIFVLRIFVQNVSAIEAICKLLVTNVTENMIFDMKNAETCILERFLPAFSSFCFIFRKNSCIVEKFMIECHIGIYY